jgi:aryl-alcohol dehydrogenase-like predicted oxidoreductase
MEALCYAGKVAHWGVSVEKVEEGLKAIEQPVVETVQIILNAFRQRPVDRFLEVAAAADVGVLARVPLASGLLSGKLGPDSTFAEDDHRRFNRHGEAFDVGETFAGVPFEVGLAAVERLRPIAGDEPLAAFALRWVLSQPAVSTVIPGASRPDQARANAAVADADPLSPDVLAAVGEVYDDLIRPHVHIRW